MFVSDSLLTEHVVQAEIMKSELAQAAALHGPANGKNVSAQSVQSAH